jgi:hypothetical protein
MNKLKQFILLYGTAVFLIVLSSDLGITKLPSVWWKYADALFTAAVVFFFVKPIRTKAKVSANQE